VTNRKDAPLVPWRDYNGRATIEQRIEELKNDLETDGFCTQSFWATEAAFLAVLFAFNLLSLYQQNTMPQPEVAAELTLRLRQPDASGAPGEEAQGDRKPFGVGVPVSGRLRLHPQRFVALLQAGGGLADAGG